jgi:hypothetical protein
MTQDINPLDYGYSRALWLFPGVHYLRPDDLSACSELDAIAEIRQALSEVDGHE